MSILKNISFAILLALIVSSIVYFSFGSIYSTKILNYKKFYEQFHSGIYQYRILSGYFLLWIYDFLGNWNINYSIFKLKLVNPNSEPRMYLSFYILNTFFLILSAITMMLITETKNFIATNSEKIMLVSIGVLTIGFTQFVIVPYDCSSYFFLLLFFWFFIQYLERKSIFLMITLIVILMISTLNRESSALSISLAATLLCEKFGIKKEAIFPTAILGISFIATYLGIRIMGESFTTNDGNLLTENFTQPKNYLGILFWITLFSFSMLISKDQSSRKTIILFHLFSLPYILMCFYSGILYEMRLYIPLFISSILLSRLDYKSKISLKTT